MAEEERDLANGYFRYLQDVTFTTRQIKQVQNTTLATDDRSIRATVNVAGVVWGLGRVSSGDAHDKLWNLNTGVGYSTADINLASKLKPFLVYDYTNNCIYYDHGNFIAKFRLSDNNNDGAWCSLTGGLQGGQMWQGAPWGWLGQTLYNIDTTNGNEAAKNVIPTGQTLVKLVPLGSNLGIICNAGSSDTSNMYLIDGTNLNSFVDIIPIGKGVVAGGEIIDGVPFVVLNSTDYKTVTIKRFNGSNFETVLTYKGRANTAGTVFNFLASKVKKVNGYIYFAVLGTVPNSDNALEYFLMRYGRETVGDNYSLSVVKNFACVPTSTTFTLNTYGCEFEVLDDLDFNVIATMDMQQGTGTMKTATSNGLYTAQPGVVETAIITGGDSHIDKKFVGFTTMCDPLTIGQSITVKCKVNADTDWTTCATLSTVGTISQETLNIEATGANLPHWKELKRRDELLGGAKLTGAIIKYEETNNTI